MNSKHLFCLYTARYCVLMLFYATIILAVLSYDRIINDGQILAKWVGSSIAFFSLILIASVVGFDKCKDMQACDIIKIATPFLIIGLFVLIYSFLQLTGFIKNNSSVDYKVLAGFDNPAGIASAITVSLPFTLAFLERLNTHTLRYLALGGIISVVIMLLVVVRSRVGLLATGTIFGFYLIYKHKDTKVTGIIVTLLVTFIITIVIYISISKEGSNSGRALILGVCWDMFKDNPLFGHGIHGFRSQYMLYQANYLDNCASNVLPMLADNITHPLNEYALLAVNFGLMGITVLFTCIAITIKYFLVNPNNNAFIGIMVITGVSVLSLFSYPFRYPLTLLGLLCALLLVYKDVLLNLSRTTMIIIRSITATISAVCLCLIIIWAHYQIQWKELSVVSDNGNDTKAVLEGYNSLYPKLRNDPYFLYNYAYILLESGYCEKAGNMATKSFDLMANYDTALFIADNAKECGDVDTTEEFYWLASKMCPVRFFPLYGLFNLYESKGQIDKMKEIGYIILSKPIKVSSHAIRNIIIQVRNKMLVLNI